MRKLSKGVKKDRWTELPAGSSFMRAGQLLYIIQVHALLSLLHQERSTPNTTLHHKNDSPEARSD